MRKVWQIVFFLGIFLFCLQAPVSADLKKINRASSELSSLYHKISQRYADYLNLEAENTANLRELEPLELEINSLKSQITNLSKNIAKTEEHLAKIQQELYVIALELNDLTELATKREIALAKAQAALQEFILLSYVEFSQFMDLKRGKISLLKFWLNARSLADIEIQQNYFLVLQKTALTLIQKLQKRETEYQAVQADLLAKKGELITWQNQFLQQKNYLADLKLGQEKLLAETRGEERIYQAIIQENKKEQAKALLELAELKERAQVLDTKITQLEANLSAAEFANLLADQKEEGINQLVFADHIPRIIWPVRPNRGISAYFQDSEYEKIFQIPHNAIDIRAKQGTAVTAAAPGIVFRVQDNPESYSYVTLRHLNKVAGKELMTVYGHLSEIIVTEGELVQAGQKLGLSGGTPGTPGAGFLTTGPHLHFEVILDYRYKDPLDFLPLEQLPLSYVPNHYFQVKEEDL